MRVYAYAHNNKKGGTTLARGPPTGGIYLPRSLWPLGTHGDPRLSVASASAPARDPGAGATPLRRYAAAGAAGAGGGGNHQKPLSPQNLQLGLLPLRVGRGICSWACCQ